MDCAESVDIWFHRYENGRDIEGRCQLLPTYINPEELLLSSAVDYNSWIESETGRKLADSLDKDVVLAEGLDWTRSVQHENLLLTSTQATKSTIPNENISLLWAIGEITKMRRWS